MWRPVNSDVQIADERSTTDDDVRRRLRMYHTADFGATATQASRMHGHRRDQTVGYAT
jgi:hypothetical protein